MPISSIVPAVDIDFTNPAKSDADPGIIWTKPGDIDLATYYPGAPPLYFARTPNCKSTRVCIDKGLVLEIESNSTANIETFGLFLELPAPGHDRQIYVLVEFDVAEVNKSNDPFLGAVSAVATESQAKTGNISYIDRLSPVTCQMRHDAGPPQDPKFRLNAPNSSGGGAFTFTSFDFFRPVFHRPIPATTPQLAFADNSTFPLVLENTITASASPAVHAGIDANLSQHDAAALKLFVRTGGSNHFNSTIYTNSLAALAFAGVGLSVTKPQGAADPTNPGPIRARVTRLAFFAA